MYTSLPDTSVGMSKPHSNTVASPHYLLRRAKMPATIALIGGTIKNSTLRPYRRSDHRARSYVQYHHRKTMCIIISNNHTYIYMYQQAISWHHYHQNSIMVPSMSSKQHHSTIYIIKIVSGYHQYHQNICTNILKPYI